jgi:coatomer subunit beta
VQELFLEDGRQAFRRMLGAQERLAAEAKKEAEGVKDKSMVQVDDVLVFRQFSKGSVGDSVDVSIIIFFIPLQDVHFR